MPASEILTGVVGVELSAPSTAGACYSRVIAVASEQIFTPVRFVLTRCQYTRQHLLCIFIKYDYCKRTVALACVLSMFKIKNEPEKQPETETSVRRAQRRPPETGHVTLSMTWPVDSPYTIFLLVSNQYVSFVLTCMFLNAYYLSLCFITCMRLSSVNKIWYDLIWFDSPVESSMYSQPFSRYSFATLVHEHTCSRTTQQTPWNMTHYQKRT